MQALLLCLLQLIPSSSFLHVAHVGMVESGGYFLALETVTQLQGLVPFGVQHELCKTHICSVMDPSQSLAYVCHVLSSIIVVNS